MALNVEIFDGGEEGSILDPESLNPEKHYRFIQARPGRVARARKQGYKPVLRSDEDAPKLIEELDSGDSVDDLIRDGDRILMSVPKERKKHREKQLKKLQSQRMKAPVSSFKEKVKKAEGATRKRIRVDTANEEKI